MSPPPSQMRLCEVVIDGAGASASTATVLTIFDENPSDTFLDVAMNAMGCVYAWDPELSTFLSGVRGRQHGICHPTRAPPHRGCRWVNR